MEFFGGWFVWIYNCHTQMLLQVNLIIISVLIALYPLQRMLEGGCLILKTHLLSCVTFTCCFLKTLVSVSVRCSFPSHSSNQCNAQAGRQSGWPDTVGSCQQAELGSDVLHPAGAGESSHRHAVSHSLIHAH